MTHLIQGSIDEPTVAGTRAGDPWTSQLAATGVNVVQKQKLTLVAMYQLRRHSGMPLEAWRVARQAQRINRLRHPEAHPLGESTIRTRLKELTKLGMVEEFDREGVTESGGRCTRYRLTPMGRDEAKEVEDDESR
ncbi:replication-relaxation family protein [Bifidobacterium sp. ESL0728]|uniref:replication-relaxation family protein n=1 Tax=Bifidobacterium sp. ESL0728 TaxID=2983220 RepID=UPI0023F62FD2|nr:replication-relaxation family protein [Bifidobacterium sp. ESL0728]WEV59707.1 replication-relaxation family protein [Bifidobacterium sp. ESL0728]